MTFSEALVELKAGKKLQRSGWLNRVAFIVLVSQGDFELEDMEYASRPYIIYKGSDNRVVPWVATQTDLLGEDWLVV